MKQYNVWFDFHPGTDEIAELEKTRHFMQDLQERGKIADFLLMKNCAKGGKTRLSTYQVMVMFEDNVQFGLPFAEVGQIGIHKGNHGNMIKHVDDFIVEVFETI